MVKSDGSKFVKVRVGGSGTRSEKIYNFERWLRVKQVDRLFVFCGARRWSLFFGSFSHSFFETAFSFAMQCRFVSILAKVFGYKIFIGIVLGQYQQLAACLQQYTYDGANGYDLFQVPE